MSGTITLRVQRYDPETDAAPHEASFTVPFSTDTSVLEGLLYIKDHLDGSLTFRWSCRMGICGSCGCMVGDEPALTCSTFLRDYAPGPLHVGPLAFLPVQRDLVIEQEGLFESLERAHVHPEPGAAPLTASGVRRQTPQQMAEFYAYAQCINCWLCYAACPQVGQQPGFLGPAALALAHRYNLDSRDGGAKARRCVLGTDDGVWGCTLVGRCSEVCPKGVDPGRAINQNKLPSALSALLSWLRPRREEEP